MYFKKYLARSGLTLAVADEDIIGKKFKFNDTKFFVNPRFYGEEKADKNYIIKLLKEATAANLVGKKAVECGIEAGLVDKKSVINITKNVPHAQVVIMQF